MLGVLVAQPGIERLNCTKNLAMLSLVAAPLQGAGLSAHFGTPMQLDR